MGISLETNVGGAMGGGAGALKHPTQVVRFFVVPFSAEVWWHLSYGLSQS